MTGIRARLPATVTTCFSCKDRHTRLTAMAPSTGSNPEDQYADDEYADYDAEERERPSEPTAIPDDEPKMTCSNSVRRFLTATTTRRAPRPGRHHLPLRGPAAGSAPENAPCTAGSCSAGPAPPRGPGLDRLRRAPIGPRDRLPAPALRTGQINEAPAHNSPFSPATATRATPAPTTPDRQLRARRHGGDR